MLNKRGNYYRTCLKKYNYNAYDDEDDDDDVFHAMNKIRRKEERMKNRNI